LIGPGKPGCAADCNRASFIYRAAVADRRRDMDLQLAKLAKCDQVLSVTGLHARQSSPGGAQRSRTFAFEAGAPASAIGRELGTPRVDIQLASSELIVVCV
jgi:hypothetical protein